MPYPGDGLFPEDSLYPSLGGGTGFSWFEIQLTSEHVGPPVEIPESQGPGLGGLIISYGGIPIHVGEEELLRVPARTRAVPELYPVSFTAPGRISAGQIVELSVEGKGRTAKEVLLHAEG